jgi:hypothetical protein
VLAADLGRQVAQAVGAPRDEGERMPPAGELAGERGADARRRPG